MFFSLCPFVRAGIEGVSPSGSPGRDDFSSSSAPSSPSIVPPVDATSDGAASVSSLWSLVTPVASFELAPGLAPLLVDPSVDPPAPAPLARPRPARDVAPVVSVGPSILRRWVDPGAVEPVLRFGPAVFVAAQDLLAALLGEAHPLHCSEDTAHCVVSRLLGLGFAMQRIQSHLTEPQRRLLVELLAACGQTCLVVGPTRVQEEIHRALVAAHFLCADYPAMTPPGLVDRLPFRLPADGSAPSLKRHFVRSD